MAGWWAVFAVALALTGPSVLPLRSSLRPTLAKLGASLEKDVLTTGSLPPQSARPEPALVQPQSFAVLLGEASSPDTLWGWWKILQLRHKDSVGALAASVLQAPDAPSRHRLTLGPFQNAAQAADFCGKWRAAGTTCSLARSDGVRL